MNISIRGLSSRGQSFSKLALQLLFLGLICWSLPVHAQTDTQPDDIAQEKQDGSIEYGAKGPIVYGFLQFFALRPIDVEDTPERFRVQRVRVKVKGKVNKNIGYQVEIDPRAPDVTGVMRDAYISMNYIPGHEIRLGQQKTRFGYENNVSSSRLFFVNRAEFADEIARGINLRDIGIGLIGGIKINKQWKFEDAITVVNGQGLNVQTDANRRKNVWSRLGLRYKKDGFMVRFGGSIGLGDKFSKADQTIVLDDLDQPVPKDTVDKNTDMQRFGTDLQIENNRFMIAGEYGVKKDKKLNVGASRETLSGYYVMGLVKMGEKRNMGPTFRYENLDGEHRATAGAYWGLPNDRFRILLNQQFFEDKRLYLWLQVRF